MAESQTVEVCLGGLYICVRSRREWADELVSDWRKNEHGREEPKLLFSANGQVLSLAAKDREYLRLLEKADGIDADGMSLVLASRLLTNTPLRERVATTDFFHDAAVAASELGLSFYFLGATEERNKQACEIIRHMYPSLRIAGRRNGFFSPEEEDNVVSEISEARPDVLWVGMGVGRQEEFAVRNQERLRGITWIKTCGGLFDYFCPQVRRAPIWMQNAGLEWLFRTIQEPKRLFWRYLITNGHAIWLLLRDSGDVRTDS